MRPRLAFVSISDAANPNVDSGYAYSMRLQLRKRFEVVDLFPLGLPGERAWLPLRAALRVAGRYYHPMREPAVLKALARRIERALKTVAPDVVFAPSSLPMSMVETRIPWAFSTDQLFCDFVETYIARPAERFLRLGDAQEGQALAGAACASYPSDWAARSAVTRYGADAAKVVVIPWGANLPRTVAQDEVASAIARRPTDQCRLVFIGRDWHRKGGDTFIATVHALNRLGIPTRATLIGCEPPGLSRQFFVVHPFLDKSDPHGFARFAEILLDAHFLLLPSRAEAYGQAFCEAAAFGVPGIGSTVGGIPTIVRDGDTGFVRPANTPAEEWAELIRGTLDSAANYRRMAHRAREDHLERLNWNRFGKRISDAIEALA
jgi:glycosyltransferase involved in cell wall biosynthesis